MQLQKKLEAQEFVVMAELEPPKGTDVADLVANAAKVKGRVDAFVISEMGNAVMRLSALGGCLLLQNRGLETVMQVCCRDRNRLALQGDLLAAAALGVANVMAVSGEDITHGDHHRAREVNDMDLLELLSAIQTMRKGKDMAGVELRGSPDFLVGATVNLAMGSPEAGTGGPGPEARGRGPVFCDAAHLRPDGPGAVHEAAGGPPGLPHPHGAALEERGHGPVHRPAHGAHRHPAGNHPPPAKRPGADAGVRADCRRTGGRASRPKGSTG